MPRRDSRGFLLQLKQSWHVRRFLLVAADVRHEVGFLEAVQDNVAADEQEPLFGLVCIDSVHAVIFGSVRSGFFYDGALGAARNNVKKERDSCTPGQPPLRSRYEPLGDLKVVLFGPRHGDTIKSRSGGGVLVLGASIAMLIAFCQRSLCISRRLSRNSSLRPSNHL